MDLARLSAASAILLLATSVAAQETRTSDVVQLDAGPVTGTVFDETPPLFRFLGIPYAAPPTGKLRWRPPAPVPPFERVRDCQRFGPACVQAGKTNHPQSEDCLHLNVWTTSMAPIAKRPVMVWLHGTELATGSAHRYDGSVFARRSVVFVSLNYRLGPLGFLAHPELSAESQHRTSGNYGFLDQIAALRWIQRNIAKFGGDPNNVTIFGSSAGGTSVLTLCASPLARGLFHRAIAQSPWMHGYLADLVAPNFRPLRGKSQAAAERHGAAWASDVLGQAHANPIAQLRKLPARQLVNRQPSYRTAGTIDGHALLQAPTDVFAKGQQGAVPLLIGTNKNEGNQFLRSTGSPSREAFLQRLVQSYGAIGLTVGALYPGSSPAMLRVAGADFVTDAWFVAPVRRTLRGWQKVSANAFHYRFSQRDPSMPSHGSPHGLEIPYLFQSLGKKAPAEEHQLGQALLACWLHFAKTGMPGTFAGVDWPAYDKAQKYLDLSSQPRVRRRLREKACDLLDQARAGASASRRQPRGESPAARRADGAPAGPRVPAGPARRR